MNIDINNLKRKPLFSNSSKLNFNRVGYKDDNHPIIILEYGDDILFLTAQSARYTSFKKDKIDLFKDYLNNRLETNDLFLIESNQPDIKKNNKNVLFVNDSLVDTTSLFVMNKEDFRKCYKYDSEKLENTRKIDLETYTKLINKVLTNIENKNYTLNRINISKTSNNVVLDTECELIFTNKQLFIDDYNSLNDENYYKKVLFSKYEDVLNNKYSINKSEDILLSCVLKEAKSCFNKVKHYNEIYDPYVYYGYENEIPKLSTNNLFDLTPEQTAENDYYIGIKIESFSDYEKEYYKQHPEEYKAKYKTYLETLKEAYYEYKNKQKECKDLDDDFELER